MTREKELFKEVFGELQNHHSRLSMVGTIVCYDGKEKFNTDGFNLAYNLHRLTNLLNEQGEFE